MTAIEALGFHAGRDPRINNPRWRAGLFASPRPYRGLAYIPVAHVEACLDAVAPHLASSEPPLTQRATPPRPRVLAVGGGRCTRVWALDIDGMLQHAHLMTEADTEAFAAWLDALSDRIETLLDALPPP